MNALRRLRRDADLSQREFAELLGVSVNTFRMWDSGLRPTSARSLVQAQNAVARRANELELLPLAALAKELGVHVRTLQAAARTGALRRISASDHHLAGRCAVHPESPANGS